MATCQNGSVSRQQMKSDAFARVLEGRPVVVADFSTASEAIVHGRTGSLVPGRSATRLAQATIAVLADPSWAARARIEGPAFVASRFDPERMVRETIDLYTTSETSG